MKNNLIKLTLVNLAVLMILSCRGDQSISTQDNRNKMVLTDTYLSRDENELLIIQDSLFVREAFNYVFENQRFDFIGVSGSEFTTEHSEYFMNHYSEVPVLALFANIFSGDTIINGSFLTQPVDENLFVSQMYVEVSFGNYDFHPDSSFIIKLREYNEDRSPFFFFHCND